jgi:dihydroflavonol-4-reductase
MVFITGGTGLLGSHLLYQLAQKETHLRALYRNEEKINSVKALFSFYDPTNYEALFAKIEWVKGDILDIDSLTDALQHVTTVYHCAGFVSFAKKHFTTLMKINRGGTANIVNVCLEQGVEKLCYVSSTAAIGGEENEQITEKTKWKQSPETSGYSISKYSAEKEVWRGIEEGLNAVIVNPSVIFGAGNWDESSLTIFRTVQNGLMFYTKGQNGFVDARDVAEIMERLVETGVTNQRFLCVGHNAPFRSLLSDIAREMGKKPPFINTPKWLIGLSWRLSLMLSFCTGKTAAITRASAKTAFGRKTYDNTKVRTQLNFTFRPLHETIQCTIKGKMNH